jgi:hypothetical protein
MGLARFAVTCLICFAAPTARAAFVIDDRSWFSGRDHVFIDFESRGDGTPLDLFTDDVILLPSDEYAAHGFRFVSQFAWSHAGTPPDPNASFSNAVDAAGSWPTIVSGFDDGWAIEFVTPVRAFGLGLVQGGFANEGGPPSEDATSTITAFDAQGAMLGQVTLWLDTLDGGFGPIYGGGVYGDQWRTFNHGFLGLATDEPIARLEFTNVRDSIIDDLHFSAVPAPGAGAALGLGVMGAAVRRRR